MGLYEGIDIVYNILKNNPMKRSQRVSDQVRKPVIKLDQLSLCKGLGTFGPNTDLQKFCREEKHHQAKKSHPLGRQEVLRILCITKAILSFSGHIHLLKKLHYLLGF